MLYQAMTRYCMIYFGYSQKKDLDFKSKLYIKKSDIENPFLFLFHNGTCRIDKLSDAEMVRMGISRICL